jgi:hypothetical protein
LLAAESEVKGEGVLVLDDAGRDAIGIRELKAGSPTNVTFQVAAPPSGQPTPPYLVRVLCN